MKHLATILLTLFLSLQLCHGEAVKTISLNGTWSLKYWAQNDDEAVTDPAEMDGLDSREIPASVPGNVEIDLERAGIIADPMIGCNIDRLRWVEGCQWCYSREFESVPALPGQKVELSFDGIDCLAEIWLNGRHIGSAANMFVNHSFDVTKVLKTDGTPNLLQVIIRSSIMEGQKHLVGVYSMRDGCGEYVYVRKSPSAFGWDILPRSVSAGLWRDVALKVYNPQRITDVFWITEHTYPAERRATGYVDIQIKAPFADYDHIKAVAAISRDGRDIYRSECIMTNMNQRLPVTLEDVDLWWPRGYDNGNRTAALYDATVVLQQPDGTIVATDTRKIGIRTVKLDYTEIQKNGDGRFNFVVNGEKVFAKGSNWVHLDAYHSRDRQWVRPTVEMSADMNCNMLRCWGGNVYEDHEFYNLCDSLGIMIWQDFSFAGSAYTQSQDLTNQVEKEIKAVVLKLRNHPSIALWSGNNECDNSLTWSLQAYSVNPNKDRLSRGIIPQVLYEFDPTRTYLPSSPYYSQAVYEAGNHDDDLPERHLWGPRGYYKAPFYTAEKAIFCSEIGYHGCPNRESLEKMMTPEGLYPWTDTTTFHWNEEWMTKCVRSFPTPFWTDKRWERNNLMINQVNYLFGEKHTDLDKFIEASQIVQGEAMKYFVERWRGRKGDKWGILWWNVRDGWPIISDAVVDYYNSRKLGYHFIKNVQHDVCVMVNDDGAGTPIWLVAVNDTRSAVKDAEVTVTDVASGRKIYKGKFDIEANGRAKLSDLPAMKGQGILLITYKVGGTEYRNHYLYGTPPFNQAEYVRLLKQTGIYNEYLK
ncbi:MAG: glycoside hydrolase family 2 [Bacteroidales bacterium]|nr:glycoside hydrolase family 2 [Bacteroidales bacterium]